MNFPRYEGRLDWTVPEERCAVLGCSRRAFYRTTRTKLCKMHEVAFTDWCWVHYISSQPTPAEYHRFLYSPDILVAWDRWCEEGNPTDCTPPEFFAQPFRWPCNELPEDYYDGLWGDLLPAEDEP